MSTSPDGQPTKVLPQSNEPPANVAPATRRTPGWPSSVPAHIGRFRTSSLVLGGLFLVLFVLNLFLPQPDSGTTSVVLPSGQTVEVPNTALPDDVPISTPATTPPSTTDPATPTDEVLPEDEEPVTTPSRPTTRAPAPTPTRAPTPTTAPTEDETTDDETTESEPTATTADETTADPID